MKLFFRVVLIYAFLSLGVTAAVRGLDAQVYADMFRLARTDMVIMIDVFSLALVLLGAVALTSSRAQLMDRLRLVGLATIATLLFQLAFSANKSNIPLIVPFYADPAFAELDRILHAGQDSWRLTYGWLAGFPAEWVVHIYYRMWAVPAFGLVILIALADGDLRRRQRYAVLYLACWIGLGNLLALAGSSVGPIFYDATFGTPRFADLRAAFVSAGMDKSLLQEVNTYLWSNYAERSAAIGSGISAFPSVHVGVATLVMLYLGERSRYLWIPGALFLAAILILSVHTGYHYAIDGYFSIVFMIGAWAVVRRWQDRRDGRRAPAEIGGNVTAVAADRL